MREGKSKRTNSQAVEPNNEDESVHCYFSKQDQGKERDMNFFPSCSCHECVELLPVCLFSVNNGTRSHHYNVLKSFSSQFVCDEIANKQSIVQVGGICTGFSPTSHSVPQLTAFFHFKSPCQPVNRANKHVEFRQQQQPQFLKH